MSTPQDAGDGEVHDILAAEDFPMPSPDPALHHGPVELPSDLTGSSEPHDVLVAEEFAIPAAPPLWDDVIPGRRGPSRAPFVALGAAVLLALGCAIGLRRRRRRRAAA